jgi:general secretion pathway protein A
MVLDYYNLREHPFGVTPDSRYLFLSHTHREALASLLYGIDAGCGFLALIAKSGLGKTALLFRTLEQLREKTLTVFLFETVGTPVDLLRALLTDFGVRDTQGNLLQLQLKVKGVLAEQARQGRRVVVVIDEAQNLDDSVLELIRMLSNFETSREKLIQIILSGQPALAERIASPGLEQLRQRVSIFARLQPFTREDTELYIEHRLRVAGYNFETPLFTPAALTLIAEYSDGIPRNINNLCFNSLSLGCALRQKPIGCDVVREVIADLDLERLGNKSSLLARAKQSVSQEGQGFLVAAGAPSSFAGRTLKFALALVALLTLGGALFASLWLPGRTAAVRSERVETPPAAPPVRPPISAPPVVAPQPATSTQAAVRAESVVPAFINAHPSSPDKEQAPQTGDSAITIDVAPRRTLLGICVESFGKCDSERLKEIRRLNPQLQDLDHIETGQKIRLPGPLTIADQPAKASTATQEPR